ncbi:MAG: hypothetical protein MUF18_16485 [Fimbriiglobus sp.]|jgi:hypothetical protein|nr:hypothetical protein [Fimbriiglobus sp.]
MKTFAVVALRRADLTEAIIAWRKDEGEARRFARRCVAAMPETFARCRVQPVDLTVEQVRAVCFGWGQEAARDGEPLTSELTGVCGEAYRRGYESAILGGSGGPKARTSDEEAGPS